MANANIHKKSENIFMKVQPVKINVNKPLPRKVQPTQISEQVKTPVKDALIVLGYTSLPIAIYEGYCQLKSYIKKKRG